ncbi:MAG: MATE family efflux transporter, partial [Elusimicrobiaceae bacterium]
TASRQMRDAMLLAAAGFFGLYFLLASRLGNNALWLSFLVYLAVRGLAQWILYRKLQRKF